MGIRYPSSHSGWCQSQDVLCDRIEGRALFVGGEVAGFEVDRNMADRKTRPTLAMIGLPRGCTQSGVRVTHCAKEDLKRRALIPLKFG